MATATRNTLAQMSDDEVTMLWRMYREFGSLCRELGRRDVALDYEDRALEAEIELRSRDEERDRLAREQHTLPLTPAERGLAAFASALDRCYGEG